MPSKWLKRTGFKRRKPTRFLDFKNKKRFIGKKFISRYGRRTRGYRAKNTFKNRVANVAEAMFYRGVVLTWGTTVERSIPQVYDQALALPVISLFAALDNWRLNGIAGDHGQYIFVKYVVLRLLVSNNLAANRTTVGTLYQHSIMARSKGSTMNDIPLSAYLAPYSRRLTSMAAPIDIDTVCPTSKSYPACKRYVGKWKCKKFHLGLIENGTVTLNTPLAPPFRTFIWKIRVKRNINITSAELVKSSFRERVMYVSKSPTCVPGSTSDCLVVGDYDIVYSEAT